MLPDTVLKYKGKGENPQAPRKKIGYLQRNQ